MVIKNRSPPLSPNISVESFQMSGDKAESLQMPLDFGSTLSFCNRASLRRAMSSPAQACRRRMDSDEGCVSAAVELIRDHCNPQTPTCCPDVRPRSCSPRSPDTDDDDANGKARRGGCSPRSKPYNRSLNAHAASATFSPRTIAVVLGLAAVLCYLSHSHRQKIRTLTGLSDASIANKENAIGTLLSTEQNIHQLQRDLAFLKKKNKRLRAETHGPAQQTYDNDEDAESLERKVDLKLHEVEMLKHEIQEISNREALQKYGKGPHYVRFDLDFSTQEGETSSITSSSFVVKMAPLHQMPHSVYLFLEMVSNKLWDGCSFVINAHHLVKASALPYATNHGANKVAPFRDLGLDNPAFSEYSDYYPHKPMTLAFVGNSKGVGFYVNTVDNTDVHGPNETLEEDRDMGRKEADPCFAEIVEGFETIKRLQGVQTVKDVWIKERVGIRSATVLESYEL